MVSAPPMLREAFLSLPESARRANIDLARYDAQLHEIESAGAPLSCGGLARQLRRIDALIESKHLALAAGATQAGANFARLVLSRQGLLEADSPQPVSSGVSR